MGVSASDHDQIAGYGWPRAAVQLVFKTGARLARGLGRAGRYRDRVLHMKYIGTGSTATQPQYAVAEFIRQGHYLPHLRRMRRVSA